MYRLLRDKQEIRTLARQMSRVCCGAVLAHLRATLWGQAKDGQIAGTYLFILFLAAHVVLLATNAFFS